MRILHLTLKRQWFDMISSGVKREEYREAKPYWTKRLAGKEYDAIQFRNGYSRTAQTMTVEFVGLDFGLGSTAWGAPKDQDVYVLRLGRVLEVKGGAS